MWPSEKSSTCLGQKLVLNVMTEVGLCLLLDGGGGVWPEHVWYELHLFKDKYLNFCFKQRNYEISNTIYPIFFL